MASITRYNYCESGLAIQTGDNDDLGCSSDYVRNCTISSGNGLVLTRPTWEDCLTITYSPTTMKFKKGEIISSDGELTMSFCNGNNLNDYNWSFQEEEHYEIIDITTYKDCGCYFIRVVRHYPECPEDMGRTFFIKRDFIDKHFKSISPSKCMDIVQSVKNSFVSKEEKLLRKTGLKDNDGNFTEEAFDAFIEYLMQEDLGSKNSVLMNMAKTIKEDQDECKKKSC